MSAITMAFLLAAAMYVGAIFVLNFVTSERVRVVGGYVLMAAASIAIVALLVACLAAAHARDVGQWNMTSPEERSWYQSLMQPDNPAVSCCGEADAYWADSFEVDGDRYVAIITDDRPDAPLQRRHVDIGTRIVVPNHKLKWDQSNPTGHGVIFLSRGDYVFCYVAPGGV